MSERLTPAPRVPRHVAFIMDGNGRWAEPRASSPVRPPGRNEQPARVWSLRRGRDRGGHHLRLLHRELGPPRRGGGPFRILAEAITREAPSCTRTASRSGTWAPWTASGHPGPAHPGGPGTDPGQLRPDPQRGLQLRGPGGDRHRRAPHRGARVPVESIDEALISRSLYTAGLPDPDLISAPPARCASPTSSSGRRLRRVLQHPRLLAGLRRARAAPGPWTPTPGATGDSGASPSPRKPRPSGYPKRRSRAR